jgi:hypothetical protein
MVIVIATLAVAVGITLEWYEGTKADDVADQIRTNLQMKVIRVAPRAELLYGESRKALVARLKQSRFTGQKVETRFCDLYFSRSFIDPEVMSFAMLLPNILRDAGWSAPFAAPQEGCNGTGVWVMVTRNATKATRDAANALCSAFADLPLVVNPKVQELSPGEPEPKDANAVVILVEAHPI